MGHSNFSPHLPSAPGTTLKLCQLSMASRTISLVRASIAAEPAQGHAACFMGWICGMYRWTSEVVEHVLGTIYTYMIWYICIYKCVCVSIWLNIQLKLVDHILGQFNHYYINPIVTPLMIPINHGILIVMNWMWYVQWGSNRFGSYCIFQWASIIYRIIMNYHLVNDGDDSWINDTLWVIDAYWIHSWMDSLIMSYWIK